MAFVTITSRFLYNTNKPKPMKKFTLSTLLFLGLLMCSSFNWLNAQPTSVVINGHSTFTNTTCVLPATWDFSPAVEAQYYSALDSADVFIDFGDGNDTLVTCPLNFYDAITAGIISPWITHDYNVQGHYPITYIVTMPDGKADTLNTNVMVTTTCNNVTGRLYVDVNSDCIYNGGDVPLSGSYVQLKYNSFLVSTIATDPQGLFTMSALPGYTYNLGVDGTSSAEPNFICLTFDDMPVIPAPNATQDLIASNTTAINISQAGDSAFFNTSNCAPYGTNLNVSGFAFGYNPATDSVDVYINFGDGNDTIITTPFYNTPQNNYFVSANHLYTAAGSYNALYIVTAPDGNADTVIHYNEIIVMGSCGNVDGDVYIDNNTNCVFDSGDSSNLYIPVTLTSSSTNAVYYTYTNAYGHYAFNVPAGNYVVSILPSMWYVPLTPTCPASGTANVAVTVSNTVTADFAVSCPAGHDLSAYLGLGGGIFPISNTYLYPYIYNQSCTAIPGSVTLILDPLVNYLGVCDTSFAPAVNGDTLTWTFTGNGSYMNWYYWYHNQGCIMIIGDPSLQVGDSVCFTMIVDPIAGDINPGNNTVTFCRPALVSFDPNAKHVSPAGSGPQGFIPQNTTFDYMLEFQNTGTTSARDIFLLDSLDSDLDISTLAITGSSHFMEPQLLPGNVLRFDFPEIWLIDSTADEPNSHGWVTYTISAKPNLPVLTQITNIAGIYFDFNEPVMTNMTLNTIIDPSSVNEISANEASVFPNPASSTVQIVLSKESNAIYTLTDLAGKVVLTGKMQGRSATISVNELPQGVYLLNVSTTEGSSVHKVMVQH
jgi:hypothetical protein